MTMDNSKDSELFNEVYKEICSEMGLDAAMKIYRLFKGQQITFPVHLFNSKRIRHSIIKEYDGANIRELSKKYGYSEKTLRRMIREELAGVE